MHKGYALILILPLLAATLRIWACANVDGGARMSAWDCVVDQFFALTLYVLVGPFVGSLAAFLMASLMAGTLPNPSGLLIFLLFGYPIGAIPAIVTGAIIGALKPWLWGWRAPTVSCALGAVLSSILILAGSRPGSLSDVAQFATIGGVAGLACACIYFSAPSKGIN
jgi:hypothetical protein